MELAALFDDFPLVSSGNGHPRYRQSRPLLYHFLDSLEDQIDQRVGRVFRRLPCIFHDQEDEYENRTGSKKRKLKSSALSPYEPKTKVAVTSKDNKFQVSLDTSNYHPDEISVKIVNDKIAISAKHESQGKDVYEFYEMYRSFDIPEGVNPDAIRSHLSASGQLTVEAPMKSTKDTVTERTVPVELAKTNAQNEEVAKSPSKDKEAKK